MEHSSGYNIHSEKMSQRESDFREKVEYKGDHAQVFDMVAKEYGFSEIIGFEKVEMGYEDDNYILETASDKYFCKIFGAYRDQDECKRYIRIVDEALEAGVATPKMFRNEKGFLYSNKELDMNLAVFEYIDGKTFYETGEKPTEDDAKEIVCQAAKINSIDHKPPFVYDSWAIPNIANEYDAVEASLSSREKEVINPLVSAFKEVDLKSLPSALVHGDIITTNVMKSKEGKIFILDFGVCNYYPRIMELALLKCNLLADFDIDFLVQEYKKQIELTEKELESLPLFIDLAHAMHVIGATREKAIYGNASDENEYWLEQGRSGLSIKN